ncbi:IS110 family transposase, partial [Vreelandella venusta]
DRAANSALHIIAIGRLRLDADTQAWRVGEGHSKLEAIRCLKRYIARELYYVLRSRHREINQTQIAT